MSAVVFVCPLDRRKSVDLSDKETSNADDATDRPTDRLDDLIRFAAAVKDYGQLRKIRDKKPKWAVTAAAADGLPCRSRLHDDDDDDGGRFAAARTRVGC